MKTDEMRAWIAVVMASAIAMNIGGCSSQSDDNDVMTQESIGAENQNLADDARLEPAPGEGNADNVDPQAENPELVSVEPDSSEQDEPRFDIAEYFFTEVDRQWFCSVTNDVSAFTDQLYVERVGSAWFERFGIVDWRRQDELDQLDIETLTGESFSLQEIFASNTILEFQRVAADSAESDLYECVLTARDIGRL